MQAVPSTEQAVHNTRLKSNANATTVSEVSEEMDEDPKSQQQPN